MPKPLTFNVRELQFGGVECGPFCAVTAEDIEKHPNAAPFSGVLLLVDEPSTRPPNGAEGHRILVPKSVARKNLDSLVGMGINYSSTLDSHNPTEKIGVIEKAWIDGKKVCCSGIIWAKDFPEAVEDLRTRGMGMSMELADVLVEEKEAEVWKLLDFDFTGATALLKDAAAYQKTSLAASVASTRAIITSLAAAAQDLGKILGKGENVSMSKNTTKTSGGKKDAAVATILASSFKDLQKSLKVGFNAINDNLKEVHATLSTQNQTIAELASAGMTKVLEDDADAAGERSDDAAAAAANSTSSSTSDVASASSAASGSSDDAAAARGSSSDDAAAAAAADSSTTTTTSEDNADGLDAELEDLKKSMSNNLSDGGNNPELGKLNKNVKNKGSKTTVSASANGHKLVRIAAAAVDKAERINKKHATLVKEMRAERHRRRELEDNVEEMQAQIDEFTTTINRKTLSGDVRMILEKGGYPAGDLQASGAKLKVSEVDSMLSEHGAGMTIKDRIAFKNQLYRNGLMEDGAMQR